MSEEIKEQSVEDRVKEAIEMFRPQLQADGGDMEYIGLDEMNRVHLRLVGACGSCPMAVIKAANDCDLGDAAIRHMLFSNSKCDSGRNEA